jgi:hypothetical protein
MRKIIIATLAAASLFGAVSAANAGYWVNGYYIPTCYFSPYYGYICG